MGSAADPKATPDAMAASAALDTELWRWQAGALVAGALVLGAFFQRVAETDGHPLPYVAAVALGALVGVAELVARYADRPQAALGTIAGQAYVAINALVSGTVLWVLRTNMLTFTVVPPAGAAASPGMQMTLTLSQVLLAGIGSMALLRSSVFTLRVRDTDIPVGPAAVLKTLLDAADRACDRAGDRARRVRAIMLGVSFDRARATLPLHCLTSMQNVRADEREQLQQSIAAIAQQADLDDEVKAYNLGLLMVNVVGEQVLAEAVQALRALISGPPPDKLAILANAALLSLNDLPPLVMLCEALDPRPVLPPDDTMRSAWLKVTVVPGYEVGAVVIVLLRLRGYFGPQTLSRALRLMLDTRPATRKPEVDASAFTPAPPPAAPPPAAG